MSIARLRVVHRWLLYAVFESGKRASAGASIGRSGSHPPAPEHAPWSDQREQALEGEPCVPGNAPQRRRRQTNVLVIRDGQLTTVSVPQHAVGSTLPDHDEAGALEGTDYPPGG